MISHENKCIFIHIPKAAGTSIISVFQDKNPEKKPRTPPFKADDYKFNPPPTHLRASDYVKYKYATKEQFTSYFKFSFVRNPWDRIVSEYKYRRYPRWFSFKEYLFEELPHPSWTDLYCHIIPQYDFLHDDNGNQLVDYVGKFENLKQDFEEIKKRLNKPEIILPHSNKSLSLFRRDNNIYEVLKTIRAAFSINQKKNTHSKYTDYYDNETIDYVAELYKKDIETFGYEFGK